MGVKVAVTATAVALTGSTPAGAVGEAAGDAGAGLDAGGAADGGAVDDRLAGPGDGVGAGSRRR